MNFVNLFEELPKKYTLCVSDFDGVQGFTEPLQMEAYAKIIEKYSGMKPDIKLLTAALMGNTEEDNLKALKEKCGFTPAVSDLVEERRKLYLDSVFRANLQPNACMVDICGHFTEKGGLKPVIVSNSSLKVIEDILDYWGTRSIFGTIYACDTFPNTDIPLPRRKVDFILNHVAQAYELEPAQIIVFEDSIKTCRQLEAAKIHVGYVKHAYNETFCPETGIVLEI